MYIPPPHTHIGGREGADLHRTCALNPRSKPPAGTLQFHVLLHFSVMVALRDPASRSYDRSLTFLIAAISSSQEETTARCWEADRGGREGGCNQLCACGDDCAGLGERG